MPFRFRKSIKIAPGIHLNIGKQGFASINIGHTSFGTRGVFHTFSLPGTGLSYRAQIAGGSVPDAFAPAANSAPPPGDLQMSLQDDGTVVYKDKDGQALTDQAVEAEKKQNRTAIIAWLKGQQAAWNAEVDGLLNIHLTTPAPNDVTVAPEKDTPEARAALETNTEVMSAALNSAFASIKWPRETNISFDITPDGKTVLLDVDLPEIESMPDKMAEVDEKALRLTLSERPKTQIQVDYLRHIHAIGFRLIGEVFAHLDAVETVVFSGYSQRLNPRTGNTDNEYLYSARVAREKWQKINFANLSKIDVVACFEEFELRRKATKQGVITAVEPFEA